MNGILILNKPRGWTSFDCVNKVRRLLGVRKAGHTGTLDPNATGVLPICLGKATKAVSMVQEGSKVYKAEVILGLETDTYDVTGKILRDNRDRINVTGLDNHEYINVTGEVLPGKISNLKISEADLIAAIKKFIGPQDQMPPIYSAKKVNGKKLYEYAREGQDVEIRPTHINIEKIDLLSFDGKRAEIRVFCSKGTYIRSLVHDIGAALNCGASLDKTSETEEEDSIQSRHCGAVPGTMSDEAYSMNSVHCGAAMGDLLRERTGNFSIDDAITLDEIKDNVIEKNGVKTYTEFLQKKIIPTSRIFSYNSLHVTEEYEKNAMNGMKLYSVDFAEKIEEFSDEYYKIFLKDNFFVGIYRRDGDVLRPYKMFFIDEG